MKKIFSKEIFLLPVLLFTLFVSVNKVNADTVSVPMYNFYQEFDTVVTDFQDNTSEFFTVYNIYTSDYADTYPYYYIAYSGTHYYVTMFSSMPNINLYYETNSIHSIVQEINVLSYVQNDWVFSTYNNRITLWSEVNAYRNYLVTSNINFTFIDTPNDNNSYVLQIPPLTNSIHDIDFQYFELVSGQTYPSYSSLYNGDYAPSISYTTIDLNNYPYVALALKNYNQSAFSTTFIVEGQLCITPVYDYGMTEKTQYSGAGYQIDRCTAIYSTPSPMRIDIIDSDLQHNAIFYLKSYDLSISNVIKVDNSIFNITYITSETENQPYVRVNGRNYPTIPYNDLTSSATKSEAEGYVSGRVVNTWETSMSEETINNLLK